MPLGVTGCRSPCRPPSHELAEFPEPDRKSQGFELLDHAVVVFRSAVECRPPLHECGVGLYHRRNAYGRLIMLHGKRRLIAKGVAERALAIGMGQKDLPDGFLGIAESTNAADLVALSSILNDGLAGNAGPRIMIERPNDGPNLVGWVVQDRAVVCSRHVYLLVSGQAGNRLAPSRLRSVSCGQSDLGATSCEVRLGTGVPRSQLPLSLSPS